MTAAVAGPAARMRRNLVRLPRMAAKPPGTAAICVTPVDAVPVLVHLAGRNPERNRC